MFHDTIRRDLTQNTVYGAAARFDGSARALTEDELRKVAPSVFAVEAHESRSERFQPIPTIAVIQELAKEGFSVVGARQAVTRDPGKKPFTKHLLRFRKLDDKQYQAGDTVAEMLMRNANDGTSAYDLLSGLFRITCLNSLVRHSETLASVKVRHSGNARKVHDQVIEGTFSVLEDSRKALAQPEAWRQIRLDRDEAMIMAEAAHTLRFADAEGETTTPVRAQQLLQPRRREDTDANLWTIGNVIQENCIRGGLSAVRRNEETGQRRRVTTRGVTGIDQDVKINKALWILNTRMAALKGVVA